MKRPGCVFAVKKEFVPKVQEYYTIAEKSAHDLAMWGAALIFDQLYYLPIPTIKFRRHGDSSFQKEVSTARKQNGINILTKKKLSSVFANAFRYKNKFNYAADLYHVLKLNKSKRS